MDTKIRIILMFSIFTAIGLAACVQSDSTIVKTVYVGPVLVECEGEGAQQCMQVKENPEDKYQLYYDQIEDFEYQEGYNYELSIQEDTVENPPAGGSSIKWTLIEVVDKTSSMEGNTWSLISYSNNQGELVKPQPKTQITMQLQSGEVSGNAGCNDYFGPYEISGENLTFSQIAMTEKYCETPQGIMEQESEYLIALGRATNFRLELDKLELFSADGVQLLSYGVAPVGVLTLTEEVLRNTAYMSEWTQSGLVQLVEGEYREEITPDSATEIIVSLTSYIAFGQVNDEQDAAVVIIRTDPGGSGTFYDLAIVVEQDGGPVNISSAFLGDRVQINSLVMESRNIIVDMITQGTDDPFCCPSQQELRIYELQDDKLVLVSSEITESTKQSHELQLKPQDVYFNDQGLAEEIEGILISRAPNEYAPPWLSGTPEHISFSFDGEERLWIMPVEEYEIFWEEASDDDTTNVISQLNTLLAERPFSLEAPLPVLPPQPGTNDLAAQGNYLYFTFGRGIRFVGRFVEEPSPIINENLYYFFQGLTYGNKYYVSFIYPISTSKLPNTYADLPGDELETTLENYDDYYNKTKEALNALAPEDFTPSLSQLDALVESLIIYDPAATADSALIGPVWHLIEVQEMNDNPVVLDNPASYTIEFFPDSQVSVQADCNRAMGRYTEFESLLSIQTTSTNLAMCQGESLSEEFISYINESNSYELDDDKLYIALKFDSVIMKFVKNY